MDTNERRNTGIYLEGEQTWEWEYAAAVCDSSRCLYAVGADGTVIMPDDLTLEEARFVLKEIGPCLAARPGSGEDQP